MRELDRRYPRWVVAAFAAGAVGVSGCNDPRYKTKQALRDARMEGHLARYAAHDAAGPQRMEQTGEQARKLEEHRREHLQYTCGLVRTLHERDVRRWREEEPLRRARIAAILRGKPEEIDDTWAKAAY